MILSVSVLVLMPEADLSDWDKVVEAQLNPEVDSDCRYGWQICRAT